MKSHFLFLILLLAGCRQPISAQPTVTFEEVASGLSQPVDIVEEIGGANRLFIVEQTGTVRIIEGNTVATTPFLNISNLIAAGGEQGLLSMAFHPDYTTNGFVYLWYNEKNSGDVTLARYTRTSGTNNTADASSGVILLQISKRFANHNGAKLNFGPDGYLYVATGDGGSGGDPDRNGQNANSLLGKMLRLDVNRTTPPYYNIPPDNPFLNIAGTKPEIISVGLRNPWRWSFDKETGDIWLADVGQNQWEEVSRVAYAERLNRNYGWNCFEGAHVYNSNCNTGSNNVTPAFEYGHNNETGGYSITGGYVYRGTEFPALQGYYLCADYVSGNGWLIKPDGAGNYTATIQKNWVNNITSFGERANGALYAVASGRLYKLNATDPLPTRLVSFVVSPSGSNHVVAWSVTNEAAGDVYVVERRTNENAAFEEVYRTNVTNTTGTNQYTTKLPAGAVSTWYRLQILALDGSKKYSSIVQVAAPSSSTLRAVIISNTLQITLPTRARTIKIFDAEGKLVFMKPVTNSVAERISLQNINKGILAIQVQSDGGSETVRILY